MGRHYDPRHMTSYHGTPLWPRMLARHYDLVSWGAIMTEYPDAIMNSYPGTPL